MKKRNIAILAVTSALIMLSGCDKGGSSDGVSSIFSSEETSLESSSEETPTESSSESLPRSAANPLVIDLDDVETATLTKLVGPFTIYTEAGEAPSLTKDTTGTTSKTEVPSSYDSMYSAIRVAGFNSTNKNKLQVQDANNVQIYIRAKQSQTYVFDGADYVGTCGSGSAKTYCNKHSNSYAINGTASDYYWLGRRDMVEGQSVTEPVLETNAGAYNYMFSKGGSGGKDYGYRYCTADVLLSQATYRRSDDGDQWNAYLFINMSEGILSDLGLIGSMWGEEMCWKLVRNCSSKMHTAGASGVEKESKFFVYQNETLYPGCTVTKAKNYDPVTKEYSGFDDLHFEAFIRDDGWTLNITNLTTKKVSTIKDCHTDDTGHTLKENTNPNVGRALIAASYCPVNANVWNWNCGAALKNVIWENITLKKAIVDEVSGEIDNDIEHYRNETTSYPFWPGEPCYRDGYSQGGYRASHIFGTHESDGSYSSGSTYKAGDKYLSYTVDYSESDN